MPINYTLHEYRLPDGADYRARVKYRRTVDMDDLLAAMQRSHSHLSEAEIKIVFEAFIETLLPFLLEGNRVVTPFGVFGITLKGGFDALTDRFNARKHRLKVTLKPSDSLQAAFARRARASKVDRPQPAPTPDDYINLADPSANDMLPPGRMARLVGHYLKFDPDDPEQGIFLQPVVNGRVATDQAPLRIGHVGRNKGTELIFLVPADLPPGVYQLAVYARFGRKLRSGQLSDVLIAP